MAVEGGSRQFMAKQFGRGNGDGTAEKWERGQDLRGQEQNVGEWNCKTQNERWYFVGCIERFV